jgi:LmbE family N-acetylglucosaminyl deacetylase
MLGLHLEGVQTVLCLGAHADDIEIGAGGTLLSLVRQRPEIAVHWVVFSASGVRADEASRGAEAFLAGCVNRSVRTFEFRDGYFPYVGAEIKDRFEDLKGTRPDLILTHYRDDLHQDHRLICELTWNTFRNHVILEYEIPKWDGGLGSPNVFVELDEAVLERKVEALFEVYASQRSRNWFDSETFRALARIRGLECNARSKLAEAFYCRKMALEFSRLG